MMLEEYFRGHVMKMTAAPQDWFDKASDFGTRFVYDAAEPQRFGRALFDLSVGFRRWRLAAALARQDIRNRYRGSVLGPLWLTLSTAVMFLGLGILYSAIFKEPLATYLPYLAASLIVWNVINQVVSEGCTNLISAKGMIHQLSLPYTIHTLRAVFRNLIVAAHNLPLLVIVLAVCRSIPRMEGAVAIFGLLLLTVNAFSAISLLGMLCARFRDLGQVVTNLMQLAFFMTPIIWKADSLGRHAVWLALNPFYSSIEVVRGPLLGLNVPLSIWFFAVLYTAGFFAISFAFFVRFRDRIAFWI
jgi:lipopolysaccharide transport system permease protein